MYTGAQHERQMIEIERSCVSRDSVCAESEARSVSALAKFRFGDPDLCRVCRRESSYLLSSECVLAQPQFSLRPSSVSSHGVHHTHSGRALHTSALASEIVAHILADAWEQL